ncbi:putative Zn-dependent protease [Luteimonas cucumeris]|uniref:Putative Zn-dependent protease n=1 Tax=Luteimonas cucumeris TaxID=985012 RepID=A0A562LBA4_9GAMM|nr:M48 family metalloprotease [Luteimonas cucumeris]TWI04937.1 putative Zn-dependent protease [Luteimonas cucumeris]
MRYVLMLFACCGITMAAGQATDIPAVVSKPRVDVHSGPDFDTPRLATLSRNDAVRIASQQGLWYQLTLDAGKPGYVRVNDVRVAYAGVDSSGSGIQFAGKSGAGRASETAGVRGLDQNELRTAYPNRAQLARMESYRVTPTDAAQYARGQGLVDTQVPYAGEAQPASKDAGNGMTQAEKRGGLAAARSLLSRFGGLTGNAGTVIDVASKSATKSEAEQSDEELALGPELAARILGARPLWQDDAAQRRVNTIGRWVATHSSRPELPWTFGVIDSTDINAFAAPGGYVLVTRGLYQLLDGDAELAAVLGHEISHIVQRDHYNVIRKQELTSAGTDIVRGQVDVGGGVAGSYAMDYVGKNGAAIMLTGLDRGAEYRSDEAAQVYLARSGYNPLALYSVLQKMTALGDRSSRLTQLYKTHPALDDRLDQIDRNGNRALAGYTDRQ